MDLVISFGQLLQRDEMNGSGDGIDTVSDQVSSFLFSISFPWFVIML